MRHFLLVVWCAAVVVILLAGCESGRVVPNSHGLVMAVDSTRGVACYHFEGYENAISCVRVTP